MKRICWRVRRNGYCGHGELIDGMLAAAWLVFLELEYPEIEHWLEDR